MLLAKECGGLWIYFIFANFEPPQTRETFLSERTVQVEQCSRVRLFIQSYLPIPLYPFFFLNAITIATGCSK